MKRRNLLPPPLRLILVLLFGVFALAACDGEQGQNHVCNFGEWQTEIEATCTDEGMMFRTCNVCGAREYEPIKPKGHVEITLDGKDATCTETGLTEGKQCKLCGEITVEQVVIPLQDHSFDDEHDNECNVCGYERACKHLSTSILFGYEASCENSGLSDGLICLDCKEILSQQTVIPAFGHNLGDWNEEIPADCTHSGVLGYYQCSECFMLFDKDDNALSDLTIPAAGHKETDWIIDKNETCTDSGIHHKECTVCHETTASESIDPKGHNYGSWINEIPADCTRNGTLAHYRCSACGTNFDKDKNKLSDLTIQAAGHKETDWIIDKNATCTESGAKHKECSKCKETTASASIDPNGHNYGSWINEIPADCTRNGTLGHYHCSACGTNFNARKKVLSDLTIQAAGHKETDWIIDEDPTCQETGTRHKECTVCYKTTVTDAIPITDHQSGSWWITDKNNTCTEAGSKHKECIFCGKTTETDAIPAAHNYSSWFDEIPSTCIDKGTLGHCYCHRCGKNFDKNNNELSSLEIELTEHTFDHDYCTMCKMKEPSKGLTYALNPDGQSYSVTGIGTCKDVVLSIPSVHNELPVTSIAAKAFYECIALVSLTLPSSIASIGDEAFYGCYKLIEIYNLSALDIKTNNISNGYAGYYAQSINRSLHWSSKLTNVSDFLFFTLNGTGTYLLAYVGDQTSIVLPENCNGEIYTIYKYAFCGSTSLENVTIPDSVTSIGYSAFAGCAALKSAVIGNGVEAIGGSAFAGCTALESATIGNGVTSIGWDAFENCTSLTELNYNAENCTDAFADRFALAGQNGNGIKVTIGKNVKNIPSGLFYASDAASASAPKIKEVEFVPDSSCKTIGEAAFCDCTSLENIIIPNSVTSIGHSAFARCTSLKSITIPDGVTSIEYWVFYNCTSLECVTIPDSVTSIGYSAFYNCTSLKSITIPDGVTSIEYQVFYNCTSLKSITIPDGVTSIGEYTFYNCTSLESITIPDGVTSIGEYTFYNCTSLESITIPDGMTSIEYRVFYNCTSLECVTIPDSVTSIGGYTFYNCTSLDSITIPDGVTSIGAGAFSGCTALKSAVIGNGVEAIGADAFSGCTALKSAVIGNGIEAIGAGAFSGCTALESVTLPDSVTSIGEYTFYNCTSLKSITIPDSVTSIGAYTFYNCTSFDSITIPEKVTSIDSYAFRDCTSLTEINFNAENCADLTYSRNTFANAGQNGNGIKVTIGKSVKNIPRYLFASFASSDYASGNVERTAPKIKEVEFAPDSSCKTIGEGAFEGCTLLKIITIPDSVTSIGYSAFYGCTGLLSITIGKSVTSIGNRAFSYCYKLTEIYNLSSLTLTGKVIHTSKDEESIIKNVNDFLFFTVDGESALLDYVGTSTAITLPNGYNGKDYKICEYAFYGYSALESITIGKGVTSIGEYAFYGCTSLESITIGNDVTSIGDYAFYGCTALTEINFNAENCADLTYSRNTFANAGLNGDGIKLTIGKNVKTIPSYLFSVNGNNVVAPQIRELKFAPDSSCKTIGAQAFYGCALLESIAIPDSVTSVGGGAFLETAYYLDEKNWTSGGLYFGKYLLNVNTALIGNFEIKDGTVYIADSAFSGYKNLTNITIPNSVIHIGNSAFSSCPALEIVTIGSGVTSIGNYAFSWCTELLNVTIGSSVTSIGNYAFNNCTSLLSITIPNNVTSIGEYAFYNCTSLLSITIPNSVTSIGEYAFYNCTSLKSATIGSSVTSIGEKAFYNCTALKTIRYAGTRAEWSRNVSQGNYWNYYYSSGYKRLDYTFICSDDEN